MMYRYTGEDDKFIKHHQLVEGPAYQTRPDEEDLDAVPTDDWFLLVPQRFGAPVVINLELFEAVES